MCAKHTLSVVITLLLTADASLFGAGLSGRVVNQIHDRLVPAYNRGDSAESWKLLSPLVTKLDEGALTEVDELLAEEGVPDVATILLDARLKLMLQGEQGPAPVHPREASLTLPVLRGEIERMRDEVEQRRVVQEVLPELASLEDYEDVFWDIHVATNQLGNASRLARYGEAFVDSLLQSNLKSLSDEQRSALDIDFAALAKEIEQTAAELQEIKTELRLRSVKQAAKVIRESSDFRDRLRAAYVIDFDGQQLIDFLRTRDRHQFSRPALREENLLASVEALVRLQREAAGDLVTKSRLLYYGMHWWLRGRYGLGPDGFGLLKSPAALSSPLAQFPLYMPTRIPRADDSADSRYVGPKFDRRHHYIWMYEYRNLRRDHTSERNVLDRDQEVTRTKLSQFY